MAKYTKPMYFKFDFKLWEQLQRLDNCNAFVRDACHEKLQREGSIEFIKNRINNRNEENKKDELLIKQIKTEAKGNGQAINDCLTKWYGDYKSSRMMYEDKFNITWITDKILPELKKLGCTTFSDKQILELFYEHAKEGKVLINV